MSINNVREDTVNIIQDTATTKCHFFDIFKTKGLITQKHNTTSNLVTSNFTNQVQVVLTSVVCRCTKDQDNCIFGDQRFWTVTDVADLIEHSVIMRKGRNLQDAPTEALTAACWAVSGPAGLVDGWAAGRDVLTTTVLGGLKTVCVRGEGAEDLPAGLERRRVGLQEYFISLMEEEDQR